MDLFEYSDYRKYLRDYYQSQKRERPDYSYRMFAQRAKLRSPNYLKLVIDGKRQITEKTLGAFVRGLGLQNAEAEYFKNLVLLDRTGDSGEKMHVRKKLDWIRERLRKESAELTDAQREVLRSWTYWAIREMVALKDFRPDPAWIAGQLGRHVSEAQAFRALELLEKVGLIERSGETYRQTDALVRSSDEVASRLVRDLHRQFLGLAEKSLLDSKLEDREMSGLTIAVSRSQVPLLKSAIKKFRQQLNQRFTAVEKSQNEVVYHLEVCLFPLTSHQEGQS